MGKLGKLTPSLVCLNAENQKLFVVVFALLFYFKKNLLKQ